MKQAHKTRGQLIEELETLAIEHRRAQESIEERDRLYRLLIENSLGLVCSHDLDGVLLSINLAAAQSLGYRPEDGIGRNLRDFLAPAVQHLFDAYLERIRHNPSDSGLMRLVAKGGSERVWFYRNVRYEEPGTPPRVLGHAQDITDLIQMEQELKQARDELAMRVADRTADLARSNELLRASEARFRALSEHATDLVAVLGMDARYHYASPSHQHLLGYAPDELVGKLAFDLVHPDDRADARAAFVEGMTEPWALTHPPIELRVQHADGTWHTLEATANNRLHDPAVGGIIVNARDITRRKKVEEERAALLRKEQEARAAAEAAVRVRDEFLAAAAHDLRTPLTVIAGHVDLMRVDLESGRGDGAEWLQRHVMPVGRATSRMLATVEDVTDAALLQMGQPLSMHLEAVEVGEMVRAVVATVLESASPRAAPVLLDVIGDVVVMGDRVRLERVLHNIVDNAVKYSPKGTPVHLAVREDEQWAAITVRDSGVGIPADELPHIFRHFYRASTSIGIPGMGIGLAGTKAIVEQHGGRISVESTVGRGTTVAVHLPPRPPTSVGQ